MQEVTCLSFLKHLALELSAFHRCPWSLPAGLPETERASSRSTSSGPRSTNPLLSPPPQNMSVSVLITGVYPIHFCVLGRKPGYLGGAVKSLLNEQLLLSSPESIKSSHQSANVRSQHHHMQTEQPDSLLREKTQIQENRAPKCLAGRPIPEAVKCRRQQVASRAEAHTDGDTEKMLAVTPVKGSHQMLSHKPLRVTALKSLTSPHSQCLTRADSKCTKWLAYSRATFFQ